MGAIAGGIGGGMLGGKANHGKIPAYGTYSQPNADTNTYRFPWHTRRRLRRPQGGGSSQGQAQVEGLLPAGLWQWIAPRQWQVVDPRHARAKGFLLS